MNWYLAKMIFRIVVGEGEHQPQFDEQLRLIAAADRLEALEKAKDVGRRSQERFLNQQQQPVCWQFVNVIELNEIPALEDGAELYYHISEPRDAKTYTDLVHQKAQHMAQSLKVRDWVM